jgi:hypothetical protein
MTVKMTHAIQKVRDFAKAFFEIGYAYRSN